LGKKKGRKPNVETKASVHRAFSSTHVALAVWYKPLAGPISPVACLRAVVDSELFPQILEGETLLNEREKEKSWLESSTIANR
jgi:hypothetical protein